MKLHIGDVVENHWASLENPHRIGIVTGLGTYHVYMHTPLKGKMSKYSLYRSEVEHDEEHYKVIGHIDEVKLIKEKLDIIKDGRQ